MNGWIFMILTHMIDTNENIKLTQGNSSVKNLLQNDNDIPTASKKWNLEFDNLNWKAIFKKCMQNTIDP